MEKSTQRKYAFSFRLRIITFVTCFCFLGTSLVGPAPRANAEVAGAPRQIKVDGSNLNIPPELGTIRERFISPDLNKPLVVYIQDAHAVYDAQKSIQGIIDHLQKQYALPMVAVEGAVGELDPVLFRAFPLENIKTKVFDELMHKGEISGVDASAILNPEWSHFFGIEEKELYFKDRDAFIEAIQAKEQAEKILGERRAKIREEKAKVYSPELLELDQKYEAFEEDSRQLFDFLGWLTHFDISETAFPKLHLLIKEVGKELINEEHQKEHKDVPLMKLGSLIKARLRGQEMKEYSAAYREFREKGERGAFVEFLQKKAEEKGVNLSNYQALLSDEKKQAKLRATGGEEVGAELENFVRGKKDSLFRNEKEKALDREAREIKLLWKLASLELTKDELLEIEKGGPIHFSSPSAEARPHRANSTPSGDAGMIPGKAQALPGVRREIETLQPAVRFYQLALQRDQVLFEKLVSELAKKKAPFAAVVTGGFHAEGVKALLKEKGYSYILISPKIHEVGESPYLDVMLGKDLSYEKYLKSKNTAETSHIALIDEIAPKMIGEENWKAIQMADGIRLTQEAVKQDQEINIDELVRQWHDAIVKILLTNRLSRDSGEFSKIIQEIHAQFVPALPKVEGEKAQADRIAQIVQALKSVLDQKKIELGHSELRAKVNEFLLGLGQEGPSPTAIVAHALGVFGYRAPAVNEKVPPSSVAELSALVSPVRNLGEMARSLAGQPGINPNLPAAQAVVSQMPSALIQNLGRQVSAGEALVKKTTQTGEAREIAPTSETKQEAETGLRQAISSAVPGFENLEPKVQSSVVVAAAKAIVETAGSTPVQEVPVVGRGLSDVELHRAEVRGESRRMRDKGTTDATALSLVPRPSSFSSSRAEVRSEEVEISKVWAEKGRLERGDRALHFQYRTSKGPLMRGTLLAGLELNPVPAMLAEDAQNPDEHAYLYFTKEDLQKTGPILSALLGSRIALEEFRKYPRVWDRFLATLPQEFQDQVREARVLPLDRKQKLALRGRVLDYVWQNLSEEEKASANRGVDENRALELIDEARGKNVELSERNKKWIVRELGKRSLQEIEKSAASFQIKELKLNQIYWETIQTRLEKLRVRFIQTKAILENGKKVEFAIISTGHFLSELGTERGAAKDFNSKEFRRFVQLVIREPEINLEIIKEMKQNAETWKEFKDSSAFPKDWREAIQSGLNRAEVRANRRGVRELRGEAGREREVNGHASFAGLSNRKGQWSGEFPTQASKEIERRQSSLLPSFPAGRTGGIKSQDKVNSTTSPITEASFTRRGFGPSQIATSEEAERSPNKWSSALAITSRRYGSSMGDRIASGPIGVNKKLNILNGEIAYSKPRAEVRSGKKEEAEKVKEIVKKMEERQWQSEEEVEKVLDQTAIDLLGQQGAEIFKASNIVQQLKDISRNRELINGLKPLYVIGDEGIKILEEASSLDSGRLARYFEEKKAMLQFKWSFEGLLLKRGEGPLGEAAVLALTKEAVRQILNRRQMSLFENKVLPSAQEWSGGNAKRLGHKMQEILSQTLLLSPGKERNDFLKSAIPEKELQQALDLRRLDVPFLIQKAAQEILESEGSVFNVAGVEMVGSGSRNQLTPASDIDLVVLTRDGSFLGVNRFVDRLSKKLSERGFPLRAIDVAGVRKSNSARAEVRGIEENAAWAANALGTAKQKLGGLIFKKVKPETLEALLQNAQEEITGVHAGHFIDLRKKDYLREDVMQDSLEKIQRAVTNLIGASKISRRGNRGEIDAVLLELANAATEIEKILEKLASSSEEGGPRAEVRNVNLDRQPLENENVWAVSQTARKIVGTLDPDYLNQDAVHMEILSGNITLLLLADGISGKPNGALASNAVKEVVAKEVKEAADKGEIKDPQTARPVLDRALHKADEEVRKTFGGSTAGVGLVFPDGRVLVVTVGDPYVLVSRLDGKVEELVSDDTLATALLKKGLITHKEYETHPSKHTLMKSLGQDEKHHGPFRLEPHNFIETQLNPGEMLILSSDGPLDPLSYFQDPAGPKDEKDYEDPMARRYGQLISGAADPGHLNDSIFYEARKSAVYRHKVDVGDTVQPEERLLPHQENYAGNDDLALITLKYKGGPRPEPVSASREMVSDYEMENLWLLGVDREGNVRISGRVVGGELWLEARIKKGRVFEPIAEFKVPLVKGEEKSISVGRKIAETDGLHIDIPTVSGKHLMITWKDNQLWARDLGSRNGTFRWDGSPLLQSDVVVGRTVASRFYTRLKIGGKAGEKVTAKEVEIIITADNKVTIEEITKDGRISLQSERPLKLGHVVWIPSIETEIYRVEDGWFMMTPRTLLVWDPASQQFEKKKSEGAKLYLNAPRAEVRVELVFEKLKAEDGTFSSDRLKTLNSWGFGGVGLEKKGYDAFMASVDGKPAGAYAFYTDPETNEAFGAGIYVSENFRRKGVGEKLIHEVLQYLKNQGYDTFQIGSPSLAEPFSGISQDRGKDGREDPAQTLFKKLFNYLKPLNAVKNATEWSGLSVGQIAEEPGLLKSLTVDLKAYQSPARAEVRSESSEETLKPGDKFKSISDGQVYVLQQIDDTPGLPPYVLQSEQGGFFRISAEGFISIFRKFVPPAVVEGKAARPRVLLAPLQSGLLENEDTKKFLVDLHRGVDVVLGAVQAGTPILEKVNDEMLHKILKRLELEEGSQIKRTLEGGMSAEEEERTKNLTLATQILTERIREELIASSGKRAEVRAEEVQPASNEKILGTETPWQIPPHEIVEGRKNHSWNIRGEAYEMTVETMKDGFLRLGLAAPNRGDTEYPRKGKVLPEEKTEFGQTLFRLTKLAGVAANQTLGDFFRQEADNRFAEVFDQMAREHTFHQPPRAEVRTEAGSKFIEGKETLKATEWEELRKFRETHFVKEIDTAMAWESFQAAVKEIIQESQGGVLFLFREKGRIRGYGLGKVERDETDKPYGIISEFAVHRENQNTDARIGTKLFIAVEEALWKKSTEIQFIQVVDGSQTEATGKIAVKRGFEEISNKVYRLQRDARSNRAEVRKEEADSVEHIANSKEPVVGRPLAISHLPSAQRAEVRAGRTGPVSPYPGEEIFEPVFREYRAKLGPIAKHFNVSQSTVSRWIGDYGFRDLARELGKGRFGVQTEGERKKRVPPQPFNLETAVDQFVQWLVEHPESETPPSQQALADRLRLSRTAVESHLDEILTGVEQSMKREQDESLRRRAELAVSHARITRQYRSEKIQAATSSRRAEVRLTEGDRSRKTEVRGQKAEGSRQAEKIRGQRAESSKIKANLPSGADENQNKGRLAQRPAKTTSPKWQPLDIPPSYRVDQYPRDKKSQPQKNERDSHRARQPLEKIAGEGRRDDDLPQVSNVPSNKLSGTLTGSHSKDVLPSKQSRNRVTGKFNLVNKNIHISELYKKAVTSQLPATYTQPGSNLGEISMEQSVAATNFLFTLPAFVNVFGRTAEADEAAGFQALVDIVKAGEQAKFREYFQNVLNQKTNEMEANFENLNLEKLAQDLATDYSPETIKDKLKIHLSEDELNELSAEIGTALGKLDHVVANVITQSQENSMRQIENTPKDLLDKALRELESSFSNRISQVQAPNENEIRVAVQLLINAIGPAQLNVIVNGIGRNSHEAMNGEIIIRVDRRDSKQVAMEKDVQEIFKQLGVPYRLKEYSDDVVKISDITSTHSGALAKGEGSVVLTPVAIPRALNQAVNNRETMPASTQQLMDRMMAKLGVKLARIRDPQSQTAMALIQQLRNELRDYGVQIGLGDSGTFILSWDLGTLMNRIQSEVETFRTQAIAA